MSCVMSGGTPTSRDEIENEVLPPSLAITSGTRASGSGRPWRRRPGISGLVPFPAAPGRGLGRGRTWLPAAQVSLGQGVCHRGSRALICKGFTEFGVQRVFAEAMAVNMASRRVMEKAGLKLVRTFHQPSPYPIAGGQFGDVEYALDKAGWQQEHAGASGCPPA